MRLYQQLLIVFCFNLLLLNGIAWGEVYNFQAPAEGGIARPQKDRATLESYDQEDSEDVFNIGREQVLIVGVGDLDDSIVSSQTKHFAERWITYWSDMVTPRNSFAEDGENSGKNLYTAAHGLLHGTEIQSARDTISEEPENLRMTGLFGDLHDGRQTRNNLNILKKNANIGLEPGSMAIFGFGIIGLFGIIRWRLRN